MMPFAKQDLSAEFADADLMSLREAGEWNVHAVGGGLTLPEHPDTITDANFTRGEFP